MTCHADEEALRGEELIARSTSKGHDAHGAVGWWRQLEETATMGTLEKSVAVCHEWGGGARRCRSGRVGRVIGRA